MQKTITLGCLKIITRLALFMQEQTLITDRAKILEHHVKNFADNHDFWRLKNFFTLFMHLWNTSSMPFALNQSNKYLFRVGINSVSEIMQKMRKNFTMAFSQGCGAEPGLFGQSRNQNWRKVGAGARISVMSEPEPDFAKLYSWSWWGRKSRGKRKGK